MTKPKPKPVSLAEFAHDAKVAEWRRTCVVCKLPDGVRAQVKQARDRKIKTQVITDWLRTQGYKIDDLDWQTHNAGLHEQRASRRPVSAA